MIQRASGGFVDVRAEALRDGGVAFGNDLGRIIATKPQVQAGGELPGRQGILAAEPEVEDFLGAGR